MPSPSSLLLDFAALADALSVLAYDVRLQILDRLRLPKLAAEVRVPPQRLADGDNPDRPMSKQAVQAHLTKLVEAGLVQLDVREDDRQRRHYYTANAARLYALAEELRSLCVRYAARIPAQDATGTLIANGAVSRPRGPALVLAHGVYEGQAFPLGPADQEGWTIGRRKPAEIVLDYDPYVSSEHARITRQGVRFVISDLKGNKNGTSVNWQTLPRGASEPLRPGDVVGVGRSLLVFVEGAP